MLILDASKSIDFISRLNTTRRHHSSQTLNTSCCCICLINFSTSQAPIFSNRIYILKNIAMHSGKGSPPRILRKSRPRQWTTLPIVQRSAALFSGSLVWTSTGINPRKQLDFSLCFFFLNYGIMSEFPAFQLGASRFDQVGSGFKVSKLSCGSVRRARCKHQLWQKRELVCVACVTSAAKCRTLNGVLTDVFLLLLVFSQILKH